MSKISLEGNVSGSGTLTIAAPNTNSNFTLTLPTETGTIITNSGNQAGSFTTLNTSGQVVFNDAGANVDFRVEGDTDANLLFVDASADAVGIGTSSPTTLFTLATAINFPFIHWNDSSNTTIAFAGWHGGTGGGDDFRIGTAVAKAFVLSTNNTERMRIDSSGALILVGSTAQKATGTTWSNPSDQRLKDNIRDYTKGTAELMQVRVREWEYNGKGGTIEGTKGLGVVADEVMVVLPDTVENYEAKLNADDEEVTAIKKFDATEITWLLVKTVQELKAELDSAKEANAALEARITAIENGA
jgi:hypothetical protein